MLNVFQRIHRFNLSFLVYPLVLSSLLAITLFIGRVYLSHRSTYLFLVWNLFLAWLPYVFSLVVAFLHQRYPRAWWLLIMPGALWLLFLPNAPYIVTDWWHLDERAPIPTWYDIGMLAMFAWAGLILGIASLHTMQKIVRRYFGNIVSWLFATASIAASGIGIYLGRFLRWNSWDMFVQPNEILLDIVERFAHPRQNPSAVGFTILFTAFMFVCYLTFVSMAHQQTESVKSTDFGS